MSEPGSKPMAAAEAGNAVVAFAVAGGRFALPMGWVEGVEAPPPLAAIPHASPSLLGAGNFAGRILPVVDLARLLDDRLGDRPYDGSGEILRLRAESGSVGLWIDRVERLVQAEPGSADLAGITLLDAPPLLTAALTPTAPAAGRPGPLADAAEEVSPGTVAEITERFVVVEIAGRAVRLAREAVRELLEAVPWTPVPRAPAGLLGVAVVRGNALPVLSAAALAGLPAAGPTGAFVMVTLDGHGTLLAVDRIVGLRQAAAGEPIDIDAAIGAELRAIVLGFPSVDEASAAATASDDNLVEYLSFAVANQDFAVPIACVDRIAAAARPTALPRPTGTGAAVPSPIVGVIELAGRIMPVAALQPRREAGPDGEPPPAEAAAVYVILHGPEGPGAMAVDRVKRVVGLRAKDLAPPAAEHPLIDAIATTADGGILRILSPERLWRGG